MKHNRVDEFGELVYEVFNTRKGKKLLAMLVERHLFENAYDSDDKKTYINLGKQSFVSMLVGGAKVPPHEIQQRIDEYNRGV